MTGARGAHRRASPPPTSWSTRRRCSPTSGWPPSATGSPEQCAARVLDQFDAGADAVILHGATPASCPGGRGLPARSGPPSRFAGAAANPGAWRERLPADRPGIAGPTLTADVAHRRAAAAAGHRATRRRGPARAGRHRPDGRQLPARRSDRAAPGATRPLLAGGQVAARRRRPAGHRSPGAYRTEVGFYRTWRRPSRCGRRPAGTRDHRRTARASSSCWRTSPRPRQGDQLAGCTPDQARGAWSTWPASTAPAGATPRSPTSPASSPTDARAPRCWPSVPAAATDAFVRPVRRPPRRRRRASCCATSPAAIGAWTLARPSGSRPSTATTASTTCCSTPDRPGVAAVDWQTVALGLPARDVAYFLGTSLAVDDRRAHEQALVAAYHGALAGHGVGGYTLDECWDDYRFGLPPGPAHRRDWAPPTAAAPTGATTCSWPWPPAPAPPSATTAPSIWWRRASYRRPGSRRGSGTQAGERRSLNARKPSTGSGPAS